MVLCPVVLYCLPHCSYPYTKADELVRELQKLHHLRSLALPAALLCNRCCPEKHYPGLRASLERLTAQNNNLKKLDLLTLPEATLGTTFFCGHPASVAEGMAALRAKAAAARGGGKLGAGSSDAGAAPSAVQQQQQQQQQQGELELELVVEEAEWADDCFLSSKGAGHPVWGVYVSGSEW
jgi:hypothetical protein